MADFTLKYSGEKINELLDKAGTALQEHQDISGKQDTLVSGKSIKTFNGESLLGEGDIAIESGGNVQGDWLEDDPSAESYICNRTHYQVEARIERYENAIDFILPFAFSGAEETFTFTRGEFSKITFPKNAQSIDLQSLFDQSDDPMVVASYDGVETITLVFPEEGGIDKFVQDILPYFKVTANVVLDDKYIPSSVARVAKDGYLYSNGEKVDMRFTRSLLPVGTSIPAKANLNSKTYLKIGKYYCSLNVDAKTITNCPTSEAFSMEVFNPLGTNVDDEDTREYTYRLRVLTAYKTGVHYVQYCATSGTAGSWTYNGWFVVPRTSFSLASSKNGGSAAKGASNRGVYIDSTGTFQQMGYTVAKSVPSNAVFTDTNTKVTSVENHYTPAEDIEEQLNATEGEVVVGIKRDAAGHVVGIRTTSPYKRLIDERPLDTTAVVFQQSELGDSFYNIKAIEVSGHNKLTIDLPEFDYATASTKSFSTYWEDEEIYVVIILAGGDAPLIRVNLDRVVDSATISAIEYIPISESYIPASIARVADVENAIASAITNVLNTPV